jgi:CRISPR-associated protein Csm2
MSLTVQEVKSKLQNLDSMSDLSYEDFCEENKYAHSLAQRWKGELKPTQLRKVFNQLKDQKKEVQKRDVKEVFDRKNIIKLMPMLAYACGRDLIPKDFYDIMKICLSKEKLKTNKDFILLVEFIEAILAFHKYESK